MPKLFDRVTDLSRGQATLSRRRYGRIEVVDGQLRGVFFRPWPKRVSLLGVAIWGQWLHRRQAGDRCSIYFNQPLARADFLAVVYGVSSRGATLKTVRKAMQVLDFIARVKRSDFLVCDVGNRRISDRVLARLGWSPLSSSWLRRNFIKRFYGDYPEPADPTWAPVVDSG